MTLKDKVFTIVVLGAALLLVGYLTINSPRNKSSRDTANSSKNFIQSVYASLPKQAQALYYKQSEGLTKEVPERLVELDQLTIGCFAPGKIMNMSTADTNLGGQCCGVLKDVKAYEVQLAALERFIADNGNIDFIPKDPYDVPIEHAQELIALDRSVTLTSAQQQLYDEAIDTSHHGGPCCCKCWKWYMMSGLAKKLIAEYSWSAHQIAELWDTSSSCGHDHDTNMHQHYNVNPDEVHSYTHSEAVADADVTLKEPDAITAGSPTELVFALKDNQGNPITDLMTHHARKLHVVIISENKDVLGHIHPEDFGSTSSTDGEYSVTFTFPYGGMYLVALNFMTDAGEVSKQLIVEVAGQQAPSVQLSTQTEQSYRAYQMGENDRYTEPVVLSQAQLGDYHLSLSNTATIKAGESVNLVYQVTRNGKPVTDLSPYLDAPMHIAVMKDDMSVFMHEHGIVGEEHHGMVDHGSMMHGMSMQYGGYGSTPTSFGSDITLSTTFPEAGRYYLFGQLKHNGQLIVSRFAVDVQ